tara:strand:- start:113 stop:514 length:402 start_codon:yes stop_codon:yes gene_type:complete
MANEIGNMVDSSTMDTASSNATAIYPLQAHYGSNKTYNTIYSGGAKISGLDPTSDPTDVTGTPIQPLVPPVPQPLPRTAPIVGIVNSEARGVYFEGTLVPVIGDGVTGIGAVPTPRLLTTPGKYGSIFIGTRT